MFVAHAHAITGTHWVNDFEHPYVGLAAFYDSERRVRPPLQRFADQPDKVRDRGALH